jgi:UDP-N-acetylmuramate--alanine ligase
VHVIFQPHRYSRTRLLAEEFQHCFDDCDRLYVLDIYAASEEPIPGVSGENLAEQVRAAGHQGAEFVPSMDQAIEKAAQESEPGDAVITLGAGSIWQAGDALLQRLASLAGTRTAAG